MAASRTRRLQLGWLSLFLSFVACTHHPMVQRTFDAREDGVADHPDEAGDQAQRVPDAGIDIGAGEDVAAWADGSWVVDTGSAEDAVAGADSPLEPRDGSSDIGGGVLEVAGVDGAQLTIPIRVQKITGNTEFDYVGKVAVSGDTIATASGGSNRVRFFDRTENGWTESAALTLPTVGSYSSVTESIAMDGDLAAVGSIGVSVPGWVHVLRRTAGVWRVEARLDDPSAEFQALFGSSVGVSSDTIVVGANRNYDGKPGSAYVFVKGSSGWQQQATLESSSDGTPAAELANDKFGRSVAISMDTVAVSRPMDKHPNVLLFRREAGRWQRDPRFQPDITLFDQPLSVALDGNSLLVGDNGRAMGFAYRNRADGGWALEDKLTARPQYNLGYSVALTGRLAVTGGLARGRSEYGDAYAFVRSRAGVWSAPIPLLPEGETPAAGFGSPVAASGSTIVVAAPFATEGGVATGAAYIFDLDLSGVP